jgi:hypothetical protein
MVNCRLCEVNRTAVRRLEWAVSWSVGLNFWWRTVRQVLPSDRMDGSKLGDQMKMVELHWEWSGSDGWRAEERLCGHHAEGGSTGCNVRTVCTGHVEWKHLKCTADYIYIYILYIDIIYFYLYLIRSTRYAVARARRHVSMHSAISCSLQQSCLASNSKPRWCNRTKLCC